MAKTNRGLPKYVYREGHRGGFRLRFRRAGFTYDFRHQIGTQSFEQEYALCLKGRRADEQIGPYNTASLSGTINALIETYYGSTAWLRLKPASRKNYRRILERFREKYGNTAVCDFRHVHVEKIIAARVAAPTQANRLLKLLKMLFNLAIQMEWCQGNPALTVKPLAVRRGGFRTWSEADIVQFEAVHPTGSQARLAFALLLYTGARRGDMLRLGRQNVRKGTISFTAQKNGRTVTLRIHPALQKELDNIPRGQMQFLLNAQGKPFTDNGFGNRMQKWVRQAGLEGLSSHGLRKAIGRRLAEAGATEEEIAAVLGDSVKTALIYTAAANKTLLAGSGIARIEEKTDEKAR